MFALSRLFVSDFISGSEEGDATLVPPLRAVCWEWGQLLREYATVPQANPTYLPISFETPGNIITFKDAQALFDNEQHENYGVCDVRIHFESELLTNILSLLRRTDCGTLTSFLTVCLQQAVGEICLSSKNRGTARTSCNVTTRILVNLRKFLHIKEKAEEGISQCFGNIIVGNTIDRVLNDKDLGKILLHKSKATALDMKCRIERGEALAASLCLSAGNFADGQEEHATFEVSNFGIYDVNEDVAVNHVQRFKGYDGVSVLAHTEKGTGIFRLGVSLMGPVNPALVRTVLQRTKDLFNILAHSGTTNCTLITG